jgi:hypothetical protein
MGIRGGDMQGRRHGSWSETRNSQESSEGHITQCAEWKNIRSTASTTSKPIQCSFHSHTSPSGFFNVPHTAQCYWKISSYTIAATTVQLTDYITLWSRSFLEKTTVPQLVKHCPKLYGTSRFITMFSTVLLRLF